MSEANLAGGSQAVSRIDGTKIRAIRERQELTQLYVATVVGVTTDTISRWENRRYPTIKQENALKLAEVLKVDLAEILDVETAELSPADNEEKLPPPGGADKKDDKNGRPVMMIAAMVIVLMVCAVLIFKPSQVNQAPPVTLTAKRILPAHVAPGQPFPVIIQISITPPGTYSMIVRETVPLACLVFKGLPAFANLDKNSGVLKWIGRTSASTSFAYLARTKTTVATGKQLLFSGAATLKKGGDSLRIVIKGDNSVSLKKLHWADANGDYRIDDEEILAVYDQLEAMTELGEEDLQTTVENIWAASGYGWDKSTGNFVIVP